MFSVCQAEALRKLFCWSAQQYKRCFYHAIPLHFHQFPYGRDFVSPHLAHLCAASELSCYCRQMYLVLILTHF